MKKSVCVPVGMVMSILLGPLAVAQTPSSAVKMSAADSDLADRVRRSVVADRNLSSYAAKIVIVSTDGNVRLSGLVQNDGEKAQIESKAAVIAGQRHVVNDLKVMPASTAGNALRDLLEQAGAPRTPVTAAN